MGPFLIKKTRGEVCAETNGRARFLVFLGEFDLEEVILGINLDCGSEYFDKER